MCYIFNKKVTLKFLSLAEIVACTNSTLSSHNFTAGENLLNSKHVIFVGKIAENAEEIILVGYCLQTSSLKEKPHEIKFTLKKNGKIYTAKCSCKDGLYCILIF